MKFLIVHAFFALLWFHGAQAEYRVYQYVVQNTTTGAAQDGGGRADPMAYVVTSTLDPVSYLAYNGGPLGLKLNLLKSWHCPGHTGASDTYCAPPVAEAR